MHVITRSCLLLFWMQTLTFVKSQAITCKLQLPPLDGTEYEPSDKSEFSSGDTVTVRCAESHWISDKLQRSTVVSCKEDGQWSLRPFCQEVTCRNQRDQHVSWWDVYWGQQMKLGDEVRYQCRSGYKKTNDATSATCTREGWKPDPLCQAITCDRDDIANADIINPQDKYMIKDQANYVCKDGYEGRFYRTCGENGWSRPSQCQAITCKLELPPLDGTEYDPSDKSVFSPGDTVTVRCAESHWISDKLQTSTVVSCKEDGQWSLRPFCQEVTCRNQKDQHVSWWDVYWGQQMKLGDEVRYRCKSGYKKTGDATSATCTREGWKPDPLCEAITCDREDIANADIINPQDKYRIKDRANYVCKDGYEGRFYRTCGENGWSRPSQCRAITCKLELPPLDGTEYDPSDKSVFSPGDTVTVRCAESHWISDKLQRSTVVSCKEDGQWSLRPFCQEVTCRNQRDQHVSWWDVYWGQQLKLGNEVRYHCKSGYKKTNDATSATCTREGWKPDPLCEAITCDREDITNADIINPQDKYMIKDQANYVCKDGYEGRFYRTCGENGWSRPSQCQAITCKLELPPLDGTEYDPSDKSVFSPGDTVTVRCAESHWISDKLQTSTVVSCKEDGQWSLRPFCQEVTCRNQRDQHVSWWDVYWGQQLKLGDEVRYQCKSGYRKTNNTTIATCTREGWKPDPLCQAPLDCQKPPPLENGDTKNSVKSIYRHNERVEYICQSYHVMQGGHFKRCNNGEWTGEIRCLRPCTVDEEAKRTHNLMFRYSQKAKMYLAHDDVIEFLCSTGRPVGSVGMLQTCRDGVLQLPLCQ